MILVVGHGPSANVDPEWIDSQDFVVRCHTATHKQNLRGQGKASSKVKQIMRGSFVPHIGTKVDAVVTMRPHVRFNRCEVWYETDYRHDLREIKARFVRPNRSKVSTGTLACLIAKLIKFPNSEVGVIGFDTTLGGVYLNDWPHHDAEGEGNLLRHIGVKDYGNYGEDV